MKRGLGNRALAVLIGLVAILAAGMASAEDDVVLFPVSQLTLHTETGDFPLVVEVARDPRQRQRGLMYRTELAADRGMIFDFGQTRPASMWMANTLIPLDMVFIRADGTVSGFHENAVPGSKAVISSSEPVRYVLEIGGGKAESYGLKPGDRVSGPALSY
ncbi:DUF192 domain-containing protein [Martelella lutilitoris]|uniref:DUF192 domain-containing protein n=1 Tax=Martelella lutilitoris TaxID=2583532 RepID=A0A7T7HGK6_9HYPH|nr:DUF192 domain-containing protein [Martelella lutilitoris]QQM28809.1 DUF192 domain-containing protein [Martelella lutilitoris]